MSIQRYDAGPLMSKAVVHGDTVYLAGLTADKTRGKSVTEQTGEILAMIDGYLAQCGTWAEMNKVWTAWVSPGNTPARATVEAKLAAPGVTVEIMVVAAK
jgi:enamine deaminase RidA (YjgF/YER057c/UK114 family)